MAGPASRFVCLRASDHDRRRVVARWSARNESLISARRIAALHADRVQLVYDLGNRQELWHGAKRLTAKVGVRAGDDDANAAIGKRCRERNNRGIEKLCFVDRDD